MSDAESDLETFVVELWNGALGGDARTSDNFFEGGGNSLQLVDLVSQIEERIAREIDFGELFEDPTLATLLRLASASSDMTAAGGGPSA